MIRLIETAVVVTLLAAALIVAEKKSVVAPVGAQSILYLVADSQRELSRMPAHFTRIPDAEEVKYGDQYAQGFLWRSTAASTDETAVQAYLEAVTARLAKYAHRRRVPIRVHYLADPELFNAFAIPGGHVYMGEALLREMRTEDQLAAVLAHEIEHIDHYHCAERLQVEAALRKIPLADVLQIPIEVFQAGYSKEQELEADREGVLLAARAGYSAQGAVELFEVFEKLDGADPRAVTPQGELAQITVGTVTGYFRSHPLTPDRIAQIRSMIARDPRLANGRQRPLAIADRLAPERRARSEPALTR